MLHVVLKGPGKERYWLSDMFIAMSLWLEHPLPLASIKQLICLYWAGPVHRVSTLSAMFLQVLRTYLSLPLERTFPCVMFPEGHCMSSTRWLKEGLWGFQVWIKTWLSEWGASPVYAPSLSLRLLVSEQYGRRSFTSIVLLVLLANIQACCCIAAGTERQTGTTEGSQRHRGSIPRV